MSLELANQEGTDFAVEFACKILEDSHRGHNIAEELIQYRSNDGRLLPSNPNRQWFGAAWESLLEVNEESEVLRILNARADKFATMDREQMRILAKSYIDEALVFVEETTLRLPDEVSEDIQDTFREIFLEETQELLG